MNAHASPDFDIPNVLILDDSVFDRARLRRAIQVARIRCSIQEVESLQAAEAAANDEEFDLAVLDYDLPDGTGHDAIRMLHRSPLNSQISMVMITGNNSVRISEAALEMGCLACISKECLSPDDLKHVFTEALDKTRCRSHAPAPSTVPRSRPKLYAVE